RAPKPCTSWWSGARSPESMRSRIEMRVWLVALLTSILLCLPSVATAQLRNGMRPHPVEAEPLGGIGGLWLREGRGIGGGVVSPLREPVALLGRAGSNHHWFFLGEDCEREPYGIVANL